MSDRKFDKHFFCINGKRALEAQSGGLDLVGADNVDVQIDHDRRTLWVNADGCCKLRIRNIRGHYDYRDLRQLTDASELWERGIENLKRMRQERVGDELFCKMVDHLLADHAAK